MIRRISYIVGLSLATSLPIPTCLAQPTTAAAPASAPATQSVPANQDTPRGALKLLTRSMENGDVEAIKSVLYAKTPAEHHLADITADMAAALAKMRKAAVGALGQENAKELAGNARAAADALGRIDATTESIQGDAASVNEPDHEGPGVKLVRVDGKWRVPVSDILANAKQSEVDEQLEALAVQAKVVAEAADDMAAGKFKSADDAMQAIRNRIMKAMAEKQKSATQPTTAPATGPTPPGM